MLCNFASENWNCFLLSLLVCAREHDNELWISVCAWTLTVQEICCSMWQTKIIPNVPSRRCQCNDFHSKEATFSSVNTIHCLEEKQLYAILMNTFFDTFKFRPAQNKCNSLCLQWKRSFSRICSSVRTVSHG